MKRILLTIAGCLSCTLLAQAQVGDPTLRTDHPQYAGEGAFQTAGDCVRFAVGDQQQSDQDKALAIYNWLLTHQWHLLSPQENCVAGMAADTTKSQEELIVYDAAKARFSYGYGLCGTVHAWNEPYWKAAGFKARRRAFPGHTNSEIYYGGGWHAFDTDMAGLLFRKDGIVAGYADVIADPALASSVKAPIPHYPFAWPSDFNTMKQGWQEVAKSPNKWFAMYNGGYEAMPGIVNLRRGETFTRYFDPDHFGGPTKRRYWHHLKNGPVRDWTFANNGQPRHDGRDHNARGNASYCNGVFEWEPVSDDVRFYKTPGRVAVVFSHLSPYVMCGDPVDDANPMTGKATDGLIVEGEFKRAKVEVSADDGQTWAEVEAKLPIDLTEHVKGRYGWQVRLIWTGTADFDSIKFTTTTQVNQALYPRLKPGGSEVTFRASNRSALQALPNFGLPEPHFELAQQRSNNIAYRERSANSRLAYETTNNKPGSIVFQIPSQAAPLTEVRAAIRYQVRVPPPDQHAYQLEVSSDGGKTWREFARAEIPADNEHSSGWLAGGAEVAAVQEALVRVKLYAGGHKTGIMDAQFYGITRTAPPGTLQVTYGWRENGATKTAEQILPAGTQEKAWQVPTGEKIRDEFVRISAE